MPALVTGASGFLGRQIVEQLLARGEVVRCFSRRRPEGVSTDVECVRGDVRDATAVHAACRGVDAVFHAAALTGVWGDARAFYETNVLGTQHVIDACRAHSVPRLIYTSSPSVVYDGRPHEGADESLPYPAAYLAAYPRTKALAEQAVLAANGSASLSTVALRPHLIFGPGDPHLLPRVVRRAAAGRLRRVGDGTNCVSVSCVENVALAHLQARDALHAVSPCAGRAYFVNEPEPVNLWAFIDEVLRRAGLPPLRKSVSAGAAWRLGAVLETTFRLLRLSGEPPMTRFLASQLSTSHWYDTSAAQRDFGYAPQVTIEEELQRIEPELRSWARGGRKRTERRAPDDA